MRRIVVMLAAACGGGGSESPADAQEIDGSTAALVRVDPCPATVDVEVTAQADRFVPMAPTITVGKTVRYMLSTFHELVPFPDTDPTLAVPANTERCFRFQKPGTYRYFCRFDSFAGMVVVN